MGLVIGTIFSPRFFHYYILFLWKSIAFSKSLLIPLSSPRTINICKNKIYSGSWDICLPLCNTDKHKEYLQSCGVNSRKSLYLTATALLFPAFQFSLVNVSKTTIAKWKNCSFYSKRENLTIRNLLGSHGGTPYQDNP